MLLALILAQAMNPIGNPEGPIFSQPSLMGALAYFEAFPANGRGTFGPCSTTAPTGAKGEALTSTRASAGMCTKTVSGVATTGVANGDLVLLSTDVARVEYDPNGVLSLRVEAARTNKLLRSQEIDNVAWTKEGSSAPLIPTVTANAGTAPDGTLTADRVQLAATGAAEWSDFYQAFSAAATADPTTCTFYVRSLTTSGTTDLCPYDGASWACSNCAFVSTSWTRCAATDAVGATGTDRYCKLGNNSVQNGGTARAAADLLVWQGDGVAPGPYATSPIPTVGAAVTRAKDANSFPAISILASSGSVAATVTPLWATATSPATAFIVQFGSGGQPFYTASGILKSYDGTGIITLSPAAAFVAGSAWRGYSWWGGTRAVSDGTNTTTGAFDGTMTQTAIYLGQDEAASAGTQLDGIISRICVDPDPLRCR